MLETDTKRAIEAHRADLEFLAASDLPVDWVAETLLAAVDDTDASDDAGDDSDHDRGGRVSNRDGDARDDDKSGGDRGGHR